MSKASKMQFDEAFFQRLGRDPRVVAKCEEVALGIYRRARAGAAAHVDTGEYLGSFDVVRADRNGRVCILVRNTDWKALIIESRFGILARAIKG